MSQKVRVKNDVNLVAPDGGWGYLICVAVTINFVATSTFAGAFGMIFKDFMIEIDMDSTELTFMNGLFAMFLAVSGYLTNSLMKIASLRILAFAGSIVYNIGVISVIFVNTKKLFMFVFVLQSFGFGLIYNVSLTVFNDYFVKKSLLAMSLMQTVAGVVAMIGPQLVKYWSDLYGYRGVLFMIAGFAMQTFVASALMQPVEWHMKKVPPLEMAEETKILLVDKTDGADKCVTPTAIIPTMQIDFQNVEDINTQENSKRGIKEIILETIDVPLLKSYVLTSACLGMTIGSFIEFTYTTMLPQALYSIGWNENNVSWALSLYMFGDLVTRIFLVLLNKWLNRIDTNFIYIFGLVIALITRLGMLWSQNIMVVLIFITVTGIARCTINVLPPLIISEAVGPEKFTSAIGIFMILGGIINLTLGSAVGAVRDLSNSYATAFYVLISCIGAVTVFFVIELCYKRNAHKHVPRKIKTSNKNRKKQTSE